MKKGIMFLAGYLAYLLPLLGQTPFVLSHTLLPSNPTNLDNIKIIRTVVSPNQATEVAKGYAISQSAMKVSITGCYAGSMLPATQTFVDTFNIGSLPAGIYQLEHKAFASAAQQWCNKIDSVMTNSSFTVSMVTALKENATAIDWKVFPNPAVDYLRIQSPGAIKQVFIYSATGALVKKVEPDANRQIPVMDLPDGMYVLKLSEGTDTRCVRFVKQSF